MSTIKVTVRSLLALGVLGLVLTALGAARESKAEVAAAVPSVGVSTSARNGAIFFTLTPVVTSEGKEVRAASLCVVRHDRPFFSAANVEFVPVNSTYQVGIGVGRRVVTVSPVEGKSWGEVVAEEDLLVSGADDVVRDDPEVGPATK